MPRPRFRSLASPNLNRTSQSVYASQSAIFEGAINKNTAFAPKTIDFERGAKEFRKKRLLNSLVKGATESLVIVAIFVCLLTIAGVLINGRLQGKSLPLTYVGDVYIGGKTKEQIKAILDDKYDQMLITFSEGGLRRQLRLDQLDIKMDTAALAEKAVPKHSNPLAFLNWQRFEVPIKMSDRYVGGYVERRINASQSDSEDARIVLDKNNVAIQSEIVGFKSDSKFIIEQLRYALANARPPIIDVTAVTAKPKVKSMDLTDDLARINTLLQTPINIKFGYSYIKPTIKQKMTWLSINEQPGSKNVSFDFSVGLIRSYIIEQVKRYQPDKTIVTPEGETQQVSSGIVVDNVDEVANSVAMALKTGSQLNQQLVFHNQGDNFTAVTPQAATTSAVASR